MGQIAGNPFYPTHPGDILKDEIEYRGISQRELAARMGIMPSYLNEVLNCKRAVTAEFALLIEATLGIEPSALVWLQSQYNMQMARNDKNLAARLAKISSVAAAL